MALISRFSPPGSIGYAVGGSLIMTYAGVIIVPPAFAALHERLQLGYGTGFALLSIVTVLGVGCVRLAATASRDRRRPHGAM
jgi:hypothetical protein